MPQRTLADARYALDSLPGLTDVQRREMDHELREATRQAEATASQMVSDRVQEIAEVRDTATADLCQARDAYAELIREADLGRISAADFTRRLNALRATQRSAERLLTRIDEAHTFVEGVQADPVAYADAFYSKYPLTRPTFSF